MGKKKAMKKTKGATTKKKKGPTPAGAPAAVHSFSIDAATVTAEAQITLSNTETTMMVNIYKEDTHNSNTFNVWVADMWFDGYHTSGREIYKCSGWWFPPGEPEAGKNYQCRLDYYEYTEGTAFGADSA